VIFLAEFDAGTVKATMTADTSGSHAAVERVKKDYKDLAQAIADAMRTVKQEENEANRTERERQRIMQETARKAREAAQAEKQAAQERKEAYRDLGITAGVGFGAIVLAIKKATDENNKLKASMTGLDSVAIGNLGTYDKIKTKLQEIQADGMIPLTNATAAYKNLISRYKDEDVAIQMFDRLANSAAFGRQAHLSLGEAIEGASEGLKNENSVLVDNVGVTENVSQMWAKYAAVIGKGANSLTLAEKRQAEINGVMEATRFQMGDMAKLQDQLSGQMAKATVETTMTAVAFGDALEPAMTGVVGGFAGLMKGVREFIQANPGLVSGITTAALAMTGLVSVTSAWIALDIGKKIAAGFTALTGPVGISVMALSALAAVFVGVATAEAKAREENDKLIQSTRDEVRNTNDLINEYQSLSSKANKTTAEKQKLLDISNKIAKALPESVKGYTKEGDAIIDVNAALVNMIALKRKELDLQAKKLDFDIKDLENQNSFLRQEKQTIEMANERAGSYGKSRMSAEQLKEAEDDYTNTINKKTAAITKNQAAIDALKDKQKALREESKNVTVESIRKELQLTVKETKTEEPNEEPGLTDSQKQKQAELKLKLEAESLEAIGAMREAALKEEELRYEKEKQIAKGNKALLAEAEQNHQLRIYTINREYDQKDQEISDERLKRYQQAINDKYQLERNLTDWQKQELLKRMQAELDTLLEINGASIEEIQALQMAIEKLSQETMPDMEQKTAEWGQELIDSMSAAIARGESLNDVFKNLLTSIAEYTIKTKILQPLLGPIFDTFHSGGIVQKYHSGGMITDIMAPVRAHTGMLVGDLKRDEVPIIAQTGERVLNRKETAAYEAGKSASGEAASIVQQQPIINNYNISAMDAQSFAAFAAQNHDAIGNAWAINRGRNGAARRTK
jgi:hypothetical protein